MDDTQQSRTSDAGITRKRRSSILKSQRAPRAPLSELEFHVTTPTDTAKSRRVSFSRRTGVAEFVTNEATTTWKNFYEEHNKSLESSGNESAAHQPRASVGHLGKRIFEDQFQEVEVIDFGSDVNDSKGVETSVNNVKFDQFALECTVDDRKLLAPGQNFEFSTFTVSDQPSKLFADDLAISGLGEITDKINVNFSTMQPIGDDLDEIQKDLERQQSNQQNVMCSGPPGGRSMSGYIEIDLNCTQVVLAGEIGSISDDMSITDTIHSPKVNVSKNNVCEQEKSLNKDWVADKENIAINPYVAPKESANFAINEEPDKILVFDGKRLTFQSEKEPLTDYRKTLIPSNQPDKPPPRKTIVLNVDDDLPNFIENPLTSMSHHSKNFSLNETLLGNDSELSMTQAVPATIELKSDKRQTVVFEDSSGNISMTQALPTNIPLKKDDKRVTIVFNDDSDISMTQVVPTNVIPKPNSSDIEVPSAKRKTLVFDDEAGNISMTQVLPTNMILGRNEQPVPLDKTVIYEVDSGDISETRILPSSMPVEINKKRATLVFNDEEGNISLTKAIPSNILLEEIEHAKNVTASNTGHTSPLNLEREKRKTLLFSTEDGNISITRPIPSNTLLEEIEHAKNVTASNTGYTSPFKLEREKRKTLLFSEEDGNISITRPIPSNVLLEEIEHAKNVTASNTGHTLPLKLEREKRKTLLFSEEDGNISITRPIPSYALLEEIEHAKNVTASNIGHTSPLKLERGKRKTLLFSEEDGNISITRSIPSNVLLLAEVNHQQQEGLEKSIASLSLVTNTTTEKRKTIVFDDEDCNISLTTAIPSSKILADKVPHDVLYTESLKDGKNGTPSNILGNESGLLDQVQYSEKSAALTTSRPKISLAYEDHNDVDISMTQIIPSNIIYCEKGAISDNDAGRSGSRVPGNVSLPEVNSKHCNETKNMSLNVTDTGMEIEHENTTFEEQRAMSLEVISETTQPRIEELNTVDLMSIQKDMSITRTLPTSCIPSEKSELSEKDKTILYENNTDEVPATAVVVSKNFTVAEEIDTLSKKDISIAKNEDIKEVELTNVPMTKSNNEIKNTLQNQCIKGESISKNSEVVVNLTSGLLSDHEYARNKSNLNTGTSSGATNLRKSYMSEVVLNLTSGLLPDQEYAINKSNISTRTSLDATHLRNVTVYQNVTSPHFSFEQPKLEQESVLSTISSSDGQLEPEENPMDSENVINAEYVTVSHRIVLPFGDINVETEKTYPVTDSNTVIPFESGSTPQEINEPVIVEESTSCKQSASSDISYKLIQSDSAIKEIQKNIEKSLLEDLLDMDTGSGIVDRSVTADISGKAIEKTRSKSTVNSADDLFFITRDSDLDTQTDKSDNENEAKNTIVSALKQQINIQVPLPTKDRSESEVNVAVTSPTKSIYIDKDVVTDLKYKDLIDTNDVDNTREILDMISKYTGKDDEKLELVREKLGTIVASDKKSGAGRASTAPTTQELFNSMCEAKAALRSAAERSPSEPSSPEHSPEPPPKKNVRRNSEVVKTLRFEDEESFSEPKDEPPVMLSSPLKKTDLRESYPPYEESKKGNVIPSYLKDVSDGIKSLMSDLVKPMVDELPFGAARGLGGAGAERALERKRSCDAQANLCTSSQIDLPEINPYNTLKSIIKPYFAKYSDTSSESDSATAVQSTTSATSESSESIVPGRAVEQTVPGGTIQFDPMNPLNNVLLFAPPNFRDVHKYDPIKKPSYKTISAYSEENVSKSSSQDQVSEQESLSRNPSVESLRRSMRGVSFDVDLNDKVPNAQYNVHRVIPDFLERDSQSLNKACDAVASGIKGTMTDQSVETMNNILKEEAINTDISMQDSKKLIEYSSSLTVVNSAMKQEPPTGQAPEPQQSPQNNPTTLHDSHVEMIYRQKSSIKEEIQSEEEQVTKKSDKRKLKTCVESAQEATPKPAAKVAKRSLSPEGGERGADGEKREMSRVERTEEDAKEDLCSSGTRSPTGSSGFPAATDALDTDSFSVGSDCGGARGAEWRPALLHEPSSKDLLAGRDSAVDVATTIHHLPFMGSKDCSWESATDDEWSFRLLSERLRLTVRLARPRPPPGRRARQKLDDDTVRGNTPVAELSVEQVEDVTALSARNAAGPLCAQFALAAMRHECGRAGRAARAGAVPAVLRACAGVARVAHCWANAMARTWAHLAYSLTPDGLLTLTVANIALRCVWEVSLRVEMQPDEQNEVLSPVARCVGVGCVVGGAAVSARELARVAAAVPRDWGHVPRALWKIFRYLKNKQIESVL